MIQLTGEAAVWWDAAGYNPWSYAWGDFVTSFLAWFTLLDPPSPSPPVLAPMYDLVMAVRYNTLNQTISEWGITEGEPMLNYVERLERDVLGQLLYPMEE